MRKDSLGRINVFNVVVIFNNDNMKVKEVNVIVFVLVNRCIDELNVNTIC